MPEIANRTEGERAAYSAQDDGETATLRDLAGLLAGHPLGPGEFSNALITPSGKRAAATSLGSWTTLSACGPRTLGWVCSHLRDIVAAFVLVVRDLAALDQAVNLGEVLMLPATSVEGP